MSSAKAFPCSGAWALGMVGCRGEGGGSFLAGAVVGGTINETKRDYLGHTMKNELGIQRV